MCGSGMESVDEELNAVLQGHQLNPTHVSLVGVVRSSSASSPRAGSSLAGGGSGGVGFGESQQSFSAELPQAMLGPGATRTYNDSSGTKSSSMSTQTMNSYQDQGGRNSFGPSTPIAPKNGIRRQGLWSGGGGNRNFMNGGRNGEQDIDPRLQVPDYPSALLDQSTIPMPDPFRPSGGGLSRYHSAPSSFLAGLAADFQQDSALSSFFSDADLPPLNPPSDTSLDNMDTEQATPALFDKFLLDTRKFERIGTPQGLGAGPGGGGGLVSQKSLQSSFKPSMEVVLENPVVAPQMPSTAQISSTSQMPSSMASSLGMPSTMGLVQQQINNSQGGQPMNPLANLNLTGNMSFSTGLGSDFISNGPQGALGGLQNSVRPNNLLRQSSSPAGLLAQLSIDVQGQMPKSEKQSLSSPVAQSPEDSLSGGTSEENVGTTGMMSGMDVAGWDDAANSYMNTWGADTFSARKRFRDNMDLGDIMVPSEISGRGPGMDHGPAPGGLTRHMSLPTPKSKAVLPDDILQSVPCRIRAKRGCATHPRSIAERVRRTRISERMRKLQELVPNMDKQQTNTADMLDEAVEYVKQLQRQVQELTESQAKCNGSCHQDHKASVT
ncbi:unnamed protein product [Calypogeia fissa]